MSNFVVSRRAALVGGASLAAGMLAKPAILRAAPIEILHWSWLAASDGEVWQKCIDNFNAAHTDMKIRMELVPEEQYPTKILASVATGRAPDFGWGTAGVRAKMAKQGVIVPLDGLAKDAGLDLADFSPFSIQAARYPKYDDKLFLVPMDLMSLQPEVNLDHVKEAGLDPEAFPNSNAELLDWAGKLTKREGDKVTRSGIMMTGSGVQPTVTWGIVAAQMGFSRASADLKTAAVNPQAGIAAMEWVLALFDTLKVSTRDVTDRYKAFGNGQGSIFWTGPWTLNGYVGQKLPFRTYEFPTIGASRVTYFEEGGLELYKQKDTGRYEATMQAVKWLSDNSKLWTTVGRGASPRKSILDLADYKTAGLPWSVRGAFVDGMAFATQGEIPVQAGPDFTIYSGGNFLAKTLETVWAGQAKPADAMATITAQWQKGWTPAERADPSASLMARAPGPSAGPGGVAFVGRGRIDWMGYVFVLFFAVPFLLFNVGPVLFGVYVGFTEWSIVGDPVWVGLANFRAAAADPWLRVAFVNVGLYALIVVPGVVLLGLAFAIFVSRGWPLSGLARTILFTPNVVSATVIGLVWVWVLDTQYGLLNHYLGWFGIGPVPWLTSTRWSLIGVSIASVWWDLGLGFVLFLAALQDIPGELYEAASIDGAGFLRQVRAITLPHLRPTISMVVTLQIISTMRIFSQVYVMTNGGPAGSSSSVIFTIYQSAIVRDMLGYASAVSILMFAAILVVTVAQRWLLRETADA